MAALDLINDLMVKVEQAINKKQALDEEKKNSTCDTLPRIVGTFSEYSMLYGGDAAGTYDWTYDFLIELIKNASTNDNKMKHLFDIGCGAANTADRLCNDFKEISLIEPNPYFRSKWLNKSWMNSNENIIHIYPLMIENVLSSSLLTKYSNSIDVIVSMHTFYHFNIESLDNIIKSMYTLLNNKGIAIITIVSDLDIMVDKLIKILSPLYGLAQIIENIFKHNKIQFTSHLEEQYYGGITENQMLNDIIWDVEQMAMNKNYFKTGIDAKMKINIKEKCKQFMMKYCKKEENNNLYGKTYKIVHYVFGRKTR